MPRRSRLNAAALLCVALVAAVGCTPQSDWASPLGPAWTADVQLLSDPVVLDDVVLAYAVGSDGEEQIKAWRLEDGEQLWRETVLPGMTARHVDHSIAALEDDGRWLVAALVPQNGQHEISDMSRFIVLDAATGTPAYPQAPAMLVWGGRPKVCDDERAFCVAEHRFGDDWAEMSMLSFYPGDDALVPADFDSVPFVDGGTAVGRHVNVKDDQLRYGVNGSTVWARDYTDVFGPAASPDAGWAWHEIDATDEPQLIGVGYDAGAHHELDYDESFDAEMPLGGSRAVGLDPGTGSTTWHLEDAQPCALENDHLTVYEEVAVLCRFSSGTFSWHWDGTEASNYAYSDVEQEILGVDINTGNVLWRHDLDDVAPNYAPPSFGGTTFLSEDGPVAVVNGTAHVVNPQNGDLRQLPGDGAVLCAAAPEQVTLTSVWKRPTFATADVYQLCNLKGEPVEDGIVSRASLSLAGFTADEPAAVNTLDGLVVYPAED